MPYITHIERFAREQGRKEGFEKSRQEFCAAMVVLLRKKVGTVPMRARQMVKGLSVLELTALAPALLDFQTPQDLYAWLEDHRPARKSRV